MIAFLTSLGAHLSPWLYVVTASLAFAESALLIGMVFPGETALLVAGFFAHQGVLNLPIMIVLAAAAAISGDAAGYAIGRRYGARLRGSRLGRRVGAHRWQRADDFLNTHGGKAVLLGRLTAVLRAVTPTLAGMSRMPFRTFLAWNVLGGLIWGPACVVLGWAFASALTQVAHYLTWAPIAIVVAIAVILVLNQRRRSSASAGPDPRQEPLELSGRHE